MTNPLKSLNHGLSEELNMLRDTTRQFVENELMPIADEVDASNDFPHHLWKKWVSLACGNHCGRAVRRISNGLPRAYHCT